MNNIGYNVETCITSGRTHTHDVRDGSALSCRIYALFRYVSFATRVSYSVKVVVVADTFIFILSWFSAACRKFMPLAVVAPLGRGILRDDVTATGKPGLRNAVARFSDGKYMRCAVTYSFPSRSCLVPRGNDARRPPSGRNLLARQDKVRYESARKIRLYRSLFTLVIII